MMIQCRLVNFAVLISTQKIFGATTSFEDLHSSDPGANGAAGLLGSATSAPAPFILTCSWTETAVRERPNPTASFPSPALEVS